MIFHNHIPECPDCKKETRVLRSQIRISQSTPLEVKPDLIRLNCQCLDCGLIYAVQGNDTTEYQYE